MSSPDPVRSTKARATWATTKDPRNRLLLALAVRLRPDSRTALIRAGLETCIAGKTPKIKPVHSEIAKVKARTRQSSETSWREWLAANVVLKTAFRPIHATAAPSAPPASESTVFSTSNWRMRRARLDPREARSANSFWRADACARSRLAAFAHAI